MFARNKVNLSTLGKNWNCRSSDFVIWCYKHNFLHSTTLAQNIPSACKTVTVTGFFNYNSVHLHNTYFLDLTALRFFFLFLFSSSKSSAPAWLSAKATILVSPTVGSGEYSSVSVSETWSSMTGSLQRGKNVFVISHWYLFIK